MAVSSLLPVDPTSWKYKELLGSQYNACITAHEINGVLGIDTLSDHCKPIHASLVFCWYYSLANSKENFSKCNLIFPSYQGWKKASE